MLLPLNWLYAGLPAGDCAFVLIMPLLRQHCYSYGRPSLLDEGTGVNTGFSIVKSLSHQPPCRKAFLFTPDLRERADVSPKHGFPRFPFFLPPNPIIQLVPPLDNGIGLALSVIDDDGT